MKFLLIAAVSCVVYEMYVCCVSCVVNKYYVCVVFTVYVVEFVFFFGPRVNIVLDYS